MLGRAARSLVAGSTRACSRAARAAAGSAPKAPATTTTTTTGGMRHISSTAAALDEYKAPMNELNFLLNDVLDPAGVRVDHIYMQRRTDHEGKVIGVDLGGSKFGGDVDRAYVILPDPMGATGSSISDAIGLVKTLPGAPTEIVCVHLIITPEYIARVRRDHPDVHIYALRLDRGMSPPEVLAQKPGLADGEVGMNEVQYIVPGAGGLGELINNSDC